MPFQAKFQKAEEFYFSSLKSRRNILSKYLTNVKEVLIIDFKKKSKIR
jgi:hypothetical protein